MGLTFRQANRDPLPLAKPETLPFVHTHANSQIFLRGREEGVQHHPIDFHRPCSALRHGHFSFSDNVYTKSDPDATGRSAKSESRGYDRAVRNYLRLVANLIVFISAFSFLGAVSAHDRGASLAIGAVVGGVIGMLFGLVFGGGLSGRLLNVLYPERRGGK